MNSQCSIVSIYKSSYVHDDVIKWKHFPHYWPFVRGIHRSPVNSPHKGQWRGALMFTLICARINGWVNNREAGDLRRHRAHYDVIVMFMGDEAYDVFINICKKNIPFFWQCIWCVQQITGLQYFVFYVLYNTNIVRLLFKSMTICHVAKRNHNISHLIGRPCRIRIIKVMSHGSYCVSNQWLFDCLFNSSVSQTIYGRNPPGTLGCPSQRASNMENVSMSCCHYAIQHLSVGRVWHRIFWQI